MIIELSSGKDCEQIHKIICSMQDETGEVDYDEVFLKMAEFAGATKQDLYFESLATKLRELWPAGEKDGKYPWRDSVPNLVKRLKCLWDNRQLPEYPIDKCLSVARKYLAQFQDNAKYMKTLKYFILRQNEVLEKDGRIRYISSSTFADMLEGSPTDEWEQLFSQGDIV